MKGLLLQYDDRNPEWAEKLIKRNEKAAKVLNFEHLYLTSGEFDEFPPYWRKVFLVNKYLEKYDLVVWIDSDAVMINEVEFINIVHLAQEKKKAMVFSSNPGIFRSDWWICRLWTAPFCAGVFIVFNTKEGHLIMSQWMKSYNPKLWSLSETKNGKKWVGLGSYGGISYEQGCFEINIFRNALFLPSLLQLHHTVLNFLPQAKETCSTRTVFLHYWSGNRHFIKKF
jgi:hypothetical protein